MASTLCASRFRALEGDLRGVPSPRCVGVLSTTLLAGRCKTTVEATNEVAMVVEKLAGCRGGRACSAESSRPRSWARSARSVGGRSVSARGRGGRRGDRAHRDRKTDLDQQCKASRVGRGLKSLCLSAREALAVRSTPKLARARKSSRRSSSSAVWRSSTVPCFGLRSNTFVACSIRYRHLPSAETPARSACGHFSIATNLQCSAAGTLLIDEPSDLK